jgi:hypothetical protein
MRRPFLRRVIYSLVLQSVEAFLAVLTILVSLPILLSPKEFTPNTVQALLPQWLVWTWAIGLLLGGLTTLTAILKNSYRLERIGVATLAGTSSIYAIALSGSLPTTWLAMLTYIMFALAMMARYWVLGRLLRMNSNLAKMRRRIQKLEDEIGER